MTSASRVLLWRHGRTTWNQAKRFQGQTDVPLDEIGTAQAQAAAAVLAKRDIDVIVASDLRRAAVTAAALAELTGLSVQHDSGLREIHAGTWEGMTHDEIVAADADALHRWRSDPTQRAGGHGETWAAAGERVADTVRRHAAELRPGQTAVLVTHGGAARAAVGQLLGLPLASWHLLMAMGNCAWAEMETDHAGGWRLWAYNVSE